MIFLSNAALRYAVEVCAEIERYQIIVTALADKRPEIQNKLIDLVKQVCGSEIHMIKNLCNRTEIYYKNGSHIKLVPASDGSRGHCCHLLIADKDIDKEILNTVFMPKEILGWIKYKEHLIPKEIAQNNETNEN